MELPCHPGDLIKPGNYSRVDPKPANIIVGKHGETLVVNWGLAKPLGRVEPGVASGERTLVPSSASGSAETLPGSAWARRPT